MIQHLPITTIHPQHRYSTRYSSLPEQPQLFKKYRTDRSVLFCNQNHSHNHPQHHSQKLKHSYSNQLVKNRQISLEIQVNTLSILLYRVNSNLNKISLTTHIAHQSNKETHTYSPHFLYSNLPFNFYERQDLLNKQAIKDHQTTRTNSKTK